MVLILVCSLQKTWPPLHWCGRVVEQWCWRNGLSPSSPLFGPTLSVVVARVQCFFCRSTIEIVTYLLTPQTKSAFAGSSSCRAVANLKPGHFSGELQFFFRNLFRQSLFGCECLYIVPVCLWNLQSGLPLRLRIRAGFVSSEISFANLSCLCVYRFSRSGAKKSSNGCLHTFCHQ